MMSRVLCYVIFAAVSADVFMCAITESPLDKATNKTNVIMEKSGTGSDILVGGYFGVHHPNKSTSNFCGKLNKQGLILTEAMRYTIKRLNNINNLLYGWNLSYRIVDSCRNPATLRRSLFDTKTYFFSATVGPPTSNEASILSTVLTALRSTLVSPSATSAIFDNRFDYDNFYRTVPSDVVQVKALIDICLHFNWTYISIVNSHGLYGHQATEEFLTHAEENNICIAQRIQLPRVGGRTEYQDILRRLSAEKNSKVVVLFTGKADTQGLLEAANGNNYGAKVTWVASTSWTASKHFVKDMKKTAKGSLILSYSDLDDRNFKNYFLNLTVKDANYTWFKEFWGQMFNCTFSPLSVNQKMCTGTEKLNETQLDWEFLPIKPVINAVESIVCVLRKTILKYCPTGDYWCIRNKYYRTYDIETGVGLFFKQRKSKCENWTDSVSMNEYGFYHRDVVLLNFDGERHRKVGIWRYNTTTDTKSLQFTRDIIWKDNSLPVSICSQPCPRGKIKVKDSTGPICCFSCESCQKGQIILNNTCVPCLRYEVADLVEMKCKKMKKVHVEMGNTSGMLTIALLFIGLVLNSFVVGVFIKNRNLRIIKASSRELCFIILMALYLCFICPFVYLAKPSTVACGAQRFMIGMSLTSCYTPLMLKTNRIYRIFKAAQVMISKPLLVSPRSQVLICIGLLGLQLFLGLMWIIAVPPAIVLYPIEHHSKVAEICAKDSFYFVINLLPCFIVMSICTIYAFLTRKFPSNFNEAQSIGATMYMSCFLWGIFIPLTMLLNNNAEYLFPMIYVCANFTTLIGFVTLIGLFGPKVVKIMCHKGTVEPRTERFSQFHGEPSINKVMLNRPLSVVGEMQTIPEDACVTSSSAEPNPHRKKSQEKRQEGAAI